MGKVETNIQTRAQKRYSRKGYRLFRNNVGLAEFQGGRKVRYGLLAGSSDLIGWRVVTVTPDMVGKRVAIFTAVEVKTATGTVKPKQRTFLNNVHRAGGEAWVCRDDEDIAWQPE